MDLKRERRVEDDLAKVFGLRKQKDRAATNRNGRAGTEAYNSLLDRLSLKFLLDTQVELLDI